MPAPSVVERITVPAVRSKSTWHPLATLISVSRTFVRSPAFTEIETATCSPEAIVIPGVVLKNVCASFSVS